MKYEYDYNSKIKKPWDLIQESLCNEDYCDLDAKEFYLQHLDNKPVPIKLMEVLDVRNDGITITLTAKVKCDDGTLAYCRVSHWNEPGSYWQPPDKGYDFEFLDI